MGGIARGLYAIAAVLLVTGVVLRAMPAPAATLAPGGSGLTQSPPGAPAAPDEPPGLTQAVVTGNVFSPSRTAPKVRYTPPDLAPPPAPVARRSAPAPQLRLFGTVVGPGGTAALIDADPAVRGAEIYRVGDDVGGRRIVAVSESTVVLQGTAGRTVLRLQPATPMR